MSPAGRGEPPTGPSLLTSFAVRSERHTQGRGPTSTAVVTVFDVVSMIDAERIIHVVAMF